MSIKELNTSEVPDTVTTGGGFGGHLIVPWVVESGKCAVTTECDVMSGGIRSNCGRTLLKVSTSVIYVTDLTWYVGESGTLVITNGTDHGMSYDHKKCTADMTM